MRKYKLPAVEFNLSHACNLKCKHCDHLSPYFSLKEEQQSDVISLEKFAASFGVLAKHAEIPSLSFLGGEPLLNRQLVDYLKVTRKLSPDTKIALITNGFLLPKMAKEAYAYLDEISVSIYPSQAVDRSRLTGVEADCATHGVNLEFHTHRHFTHNVVSEKIPDENLVRNIFLTCSLAWKQHCHTLFDGWITRCSRLPFMDLKLLHTGRIAAGFMERDALKITDEDDFPEKLKAYMESDQPLAACEYCLGTVGKPFKHAQLSKDEIQRESWSEVGYKGNINWIKLYRRMVKRKLLGRF
jgi:organic radical activating enzyme